MSQINNIWSKEYTNNNFSYTPAVGQNNFTTVSIILISGSATFTGGATFNTIVSGAINLQVGVALNLGVNNIPLNSFDIACSSAVYQIVATISSTL